MEAAIANNSNPVFTINMAIVIATYQAWSAFIFWHAYPLADIAFLIGWATRDDLYECCRENYRLQQRFVEYPIVILRLIDVFLDTWFVSSRISCRAQQDSRSYRPYQRRKAHHENYCQKDENYYRNQSMLPSIIAYHIAEFFVEFPQHNLMKRIEWKSFPLLWTCLLSIDFGFRQWVFQFFIYMFIFRVNV